MKQRSKICKKGHYITGKGGVLPTLIDEQQLIESENEDWMPKSSTVVRIAQIPSLPVTELELVKFELVSKLVTTQPFIHHCLPRSVSSSWIRFPCEFLRSWETAGKLWKLLFLLSHPDAFRLEIKTLHNSLVQTSHFEMSYKCFFLLSKIVIPCATQRWGCFSRVLQSTLLRGGQKTIEGRPITRWINCN